MFEFKSLIKEELILRLQKELRDIEEAAKSSRDYAITDEVKSEGKYDTRAIEASYLASAQLARVEELKLDLQMLEELELQTSNHVELGAIVVVELNQKKQSFFISPNLGGEIVTIKNNPFLIISVFSPIGSEALNLTVDDHFEVETPKENRSYKILEIY